VGPGTRCGSPAWQCQVALAVSCGGCGVPGRGLGRSHAHRGLDRQPAGRLGGCRVAAVPLRTQGAIDRAETRAADAVDVPLGTFLRTQSAIDRARTRAADAVEVSSLLRSRYLATRFPCRVVPAEVGPSRARAQHFGSASVVSGMDDYMLLMVKMRGEALMREARRDGLAAEARRAARTRQTVPAAARRLVLRPAQWLAMAAARMRPTTTGR
jgi:hypothetical protein